MAIESVASGLRTSLQLFGSGHKDGTRTLVDDFGVGGGQGDGVVAGFEVDGDGPEEASVGSVGRAEDEVGAGRDWRGQGGFASAVEGGLANEVGMHGGSVCGAALRRAAVGHIGYQGFAGSY